MYKRLKRSSFVLFFTLTALVIAGCDGGGSNESTDETAQQEQADESHHHDEGEHREGEHQHGEHHASADESKAVEVPDEGKEFDPSVSADQVPEGAWHCDMNGEVHYAAMEEGDGECPVCGMDLVQN